MTAHQTTTPPAAGVLFARYFAAVVVSLFTWAVIGILGFLAEAAVVTAFRVGEMVLTIAFYTIFAATGFSGVFVGSLCLSRGSRRFGSVLLAVLGIVAFRMFWLCAPYRQDGPQDIPPTFFSTSSSFWPFCGGLLVAMILFLVRRSPNTALEPTPTAH